MRKSERTSRGNPYKLALLVLKHEARQLSGAPHWGRSIMKMRVLVFTYLILFFAAFPLYAHRDTRLEFKDGKIVGLPSEYSPASLDLSAGVLIIGGRRLEFSEYVRDILTDPERYDLIIFSSWYHKLDTLPPYICLRLTPKGTDFSYRILIDMKGMVVMQADLELKESETLTRLVPIDPACWKSDQDGEATKTIK